MEARKLPKLAMAIGILLGAAAGALPARADPVAEFYKDATINLYIGFPAGGGYDIYGRLVARHLGRHIPGNPKIVPQNMVGAGGIRAANFLYSAAPKDGTAIGIIPDTAPSEELLGTQGVAYVSKNFNWIGRITSSINVQAFWHTSKITSIADLMQRESVVGGSGPAAPAVTYPKALNALVGTKMKVVTGYGGAAESCLAMERGEVDGCLTAWTTVKVAKRQWLDEKKANIVIQWGDKRHPELPDIPAMVELGKTPEDRAVLGLYASATELGKSLLAPPGVAPARVKALRDAFSAMLRDPEVLAEVQKLNLDWDPMVGEELQGYIERVSNVPTELIARAKAIQEAK
jgi:tripartite-type tricarboxylate transporter receptor subunit TctC